MINHFHKERS
ncbi:hypothetical protein VCHENC02_1197A, partial [Vibrio harveyi]